MSGELPADLSAFLGPSTSNESGKSSKGKKNSSKQKENQVEQKELGKEVKEIDVPVAEKASIPAYTDQTPQRSHVEILASSSSRPREQVSIVEMYEGIPSIASAPPPRQGISPELQTYLNAKRTCEEYEAKEANTQVEVLSDPYSTTGHLLEGSASQTHAKKSIPRFPFQKSRTVNQLNQAKTPSASSSKAAVAKQPRAGFSKKQQGTQRSATPVALTRNQAGEESRGGKRQEIHDEIRELNSKEVPIQPQSTLAEGLEDEIRRIKLKNAKEMGKLLEGFSTICELQKENSECLKEMKQACEGNQERLTALIDVLVDAVNMIKSAYQATDNEPAFHPEEEAQKLEDAA